MKSSGTRSYGLNTLRQIPKSNLKNLKIIYFNLDKKAEYLNYELLESPNNALFASYLILKVNDSENQN